MQIKELEIISIVFAKKFIFGDLIRTTHKIYMPSILESALFEEVLP